MSKAEINKPKTFMSYIVEGLKQSSNEHLGNRSALKGDDWYVGGSDVGQCLKKSYFTKTLQEVVHNDKQQLIFSRGKAFEALVEEGLRNNPQKLDYTREAEEVYKNNEVNIKSHIDFVVHFPKEDLVIELKTISTEVEEPYESWVMQVQMGMGLLRKSGKKCNRAKIIALNMNTGEHSEFDIAFSQALFEAALKRAKELYIAVENRVEPKGEQNHLCSFCPFKGQCETLRREAINLPKDIAVMAKKAKALLKGEKEAKEIKRNLMAYLQAARTRKGVADDVTLSIRTVNKKAVPVAKLKELIDEDTLKSLEEDSSFSYLQVVA